MNAEEFNFISLLLKKRSGLAIDTDKTYLLESRLLPIARQCGVQDLSEFVQLLKTKPAENVIAEVVDAMTTNESMFFRDKKPFDQLRQIILPRIKKIHRSGKIRIWCAACSNGQEPYSVAMALLEEAENMAGFTYEILATDISLRVLAKAKEGLYSQFEVQRGLPVQMLLKYFQQKPGALWQVNAILQDMVTFRQQNLLDDLTKLGKFDIILCRNVLIYFDDPMKRAILGRISQLLHPESVLMLGSAETVIGISDKYQLLGNERGIHILAV